MDDILAFIWRNNLLKRESLRCCDGRGLRVVSPGRETSCGSGVFAGAVIETDGKRTSGNVAVSPSPKGGKTGNVILTVVEADGDLRKWNSSSPTLLVGNRPRNKRGGAKPAFENGGGSVRRDYDAIAAAVRRRLVYVAGAGTPPEQEYEDSKMAGTVQR